MNRIRFVTILTAAIAGATAGAQYRVIGPNIIANGDFSKGNVGFTSALTYTKPAFNCVWGAYYTIAPNFNRPLLHELIAPDAFLPPLRPTGKEQAMYGNSGGVEAMTVYSTFAKCQPHTKYLITFNVISVSGHPDTSTPPHQIATEEWVSDWHVEANDDHGVPTRAGCGEWNKVTMLWDSGDVSTVNVKIIRDRLEHGGGIVGIANISMVPVKGPSDP